MQFNVAQLLKERIGSERLHHLDDEFDPLPETGADFARGDLRFVRTEKGVWVSGEVESDVVVTCSRCLEDSRQSVRFFLDDEWYPVVDVLTGVRLPTPVEDEECFVIDERHVLDLFEAVRQYVITSVPMKPLCQEGCPGICPLCGAHLKREACQCAGERRDRRWGALLGMLAQGQG